MTTQDKNVTGEVSPTNRRLSRREFLRAASVSPSGPSGIRKNDASHYGAGATRISRHFGSRKNKSMEDR